MDYITVIKAARPVNKRFVLQPDGTVEKSGVATLYSGVAQSRHVPDAEAMARVLEEVTESTHLVIVAGRWRGDDGTPFEIVTKDELTKRLGVSEADLPDGIVEVGGVRCAARLQRMVEPSSWILLDADSPKGIPPEWAAMDAARRLELFEQLLPGIGAVDRVELRSSSARVRRPGETKRGPSHIWLRVSDPSRIDVLKTHVETAQVNAGLSFKSPHHSRWDPTQVVGHTPRGLFDTAVWSQERIVFVARPDVSAGLELDDADVGIYPANEGLPALDLSRIQLPDVAARREYRDRTGIALAMQRTNSGGLSIISRGELTMATEIEVSGEVKTLAQWVDHMKTHKLDKLRCEAPFRASESEAAFIGFRRDGSPFVWDSGTSTSYRLADASGEVIDELNARYSFVSEGGRARVYERKQSAVFGEYYEPILPADFRVMHDNRRIEIGTMANGQPRHIGVGTHWLTHPERRQYLGGVVFDPTEKKTAPDQLNIWMGFGVKPQPGGSWALLRQHILEVICDGNEGYFSYLLSWMARVVQLPAEPGEVAVVMQGGEGTGKGTLANAMAHILGPSAFATSRSNDVVGQFNAHLRHRVFLFCDEAFFAGKRQDADALKGLITEPTFATEGKGGAIISWPNYLHIMMASNADWVINASIDSRRYFVLKLRPLTPDRDQAYFASIRKELAKGGYEAMLHDLLHHDLTGFNVRQFPKTPALFEQRVRSLTGVVAWMYEMLSLGHLVGSGEAEWQEWYSTKALYEDYRLHAARLRYGPGGVGEVEFGRQIARWAVAHRPSGKGRGYRFGPLGEARTEFCRVIGLADEWEPD